MAIDGPAAPTRLLIVDDHPIVRTGLRGMLAGQPGFAIVGEAANGADALALIARLRPDVALMDLRMPILDGVATTREIRARYPETRVLVLTTHDSDADILRAIEAGATGYLLKDAPPDELCRAIAAAARGETFLTPTVASRVMVRLRAPAEEALSAREIEVLAQARRGASNKEIAHALRISEATVKSHLIHIFEKLGVADRTAAVATALERGILPLGDSQRRG